MTLKSLKPKIATIDTRIGSPVVKRIRGRALTRIRERILLRDGYECRKCRRVFSPWNLEIDHVVPLHLGGIADSDENLQTLCIWCHEKKSKEENKNM